ncbi:MAG: hypothetical protein H6684_07130 [Deltaproteobacteria bacterium]|nr:hypothetical protein [Deltaproteobacteria bacterium]MCB9488485.1 hypothetical protein [Deltaproteobacteria bacterium]
MAFLTLAVGCAPRVDFTPKPSRGDVYEQARTMSLNLFGMAFFVTENVRYEERLIGVDEQYLDLEFVPMEYQITSTGPDGTREIYGTALLEQGGENLDVAFLRSYVGKTVRVRALRSGEVEKLTLEGKLSDYHLEGVTPELLQQTAQEILERTFIGPHIMMTHSILPAKAIAPGKTYRPVGQILKTEEEAPEAMMQVQSVDEDGQAVIVMDPESISEVFDAAARAMRWPEALEGKVDLAGDGEGRFIYDTRSHQITSAKVRLSAKPIVTRDSETAAELFRFNVSIAVNKVGETTPNP